MQTSTKDSAFQVYPGVIRLIATAINLNSAAADVATITGLPAKYIVRRVTAFDVSTSLAASAASLGVFTAAGGGGTAVVADGTMIALTGASKFLDRTVAASTDYLTASSLILRCGTAFGSAATVSVIIEVNDLTLNIP